MALRRVARRKKRTTMKMIAIRMTTRTYLTIKRMGTTLSM
jgi:hypothetical protein